ncbi:hypothetical protein [uncultured Shimia sp.]|uniref:hypothetical protein n=1 Tax=uncultured Shimia sp. TaxID=573152 RepID=UPI0025EF13B8|nr:hypothetical protein [uncultured Shimia sp.]
MDEKSVTQNHREGMAKFGRQIGTFFAKISEDAETALVKWIIYLDEGAHSGPDASLFPAMALVIQVNAGFAENGITCAHWKTAEPVHKIATPSSTTLDCPHMAPAPCAAHLLAILQKRAGRLSSAEQQELKGSEVGLQYHEFMLVNEPERRGLYFLETLSSFV